MGRNKRMRHRKGKQSETSGSGGKKADPREGRPNYTLTVKKNELLEEYYKNQPWLPEEEAKAFFETLRTPLPATFRITGSNIHAQELLQFIKGKYFSKITEGTTIEGEQIKPPQCIPWYPNEQAWQMSLDRKTIRHHETLGMLHEFLVSETESGYISRQEAVSMIPPLLMDIKPHHSVLDMCAAPGSKTAQLIELLHAEEEATGKLPTGYVLANDADNKRCYLMMHQVKRLASPNFLIINHDATQLPNFHLTPVHDEGKKVIKFDRILTDVPCSGDGTLRKNPDIWAKWHPVIAFNLHSIQRRILERAAQMLAVGGRLVYSTCTVNPVEDEAVLCDVLQKCEGALQIVDVSHELPGLKYIPGVSSWKILSREKVWYENFESVPENLRTQIRPSMFPPPPDVAAKLNLHRCLRILPHHQNTGGFFVCVIEKVKEVPWVGKSATGAAANEEGSDTVKEEGEEEENSAEQSAEDSALPGEKRKITNDDGRAPSKKKKPGYMGFKEDPFVFLTKEDPTMAPVLDCYGVNSDFPITQLLVRSHVGKKRIIYFASKEIKNILECNQGRVKFINGGVKIFARSDSSSRVTTECDFRLVQDGMHVISQFLSQRRVNIDAQDLGVLMTNENPYMTKFSESTQQQVETMTPGGMYFSYEPTEGSEGPRCKLLLAGWQGVKSTRLFMDRGNRFHFMRMLGVDPPTKKERKDRAAVEEDKAATKAAENDNDDADSLDGDEGIKSEDVHESNGEASLKAENDAEDNQTEADPVVLSENTDLEEVMLKS